MLLWNPNGSKSWEDAENGMTATPPDSRSSTSRLYDGQNSIASQIAVIGSGGSGT